MSCGKADEFIVVIMNEYVSKQYLLDSCSAFKWRSNERFNSDISFQKPTLLLWMIHDKHQ